MRPGASSIQRRLAKEISSLKGRELDGFTFKEDKSNINHFTFIIDGPSGTPFEGGKFELDVTLTPRYPFEAPKCFFKTYVWHPNIYGPEGEICVDILKPDNWSPAISLESLVLSIISLIGDPNPYSPLNGEAARLYMENREAYNKRVREEVKKHAMG